MEDLKSTPEKKLLPSAHPVHVIVRFELGEGQLETLFGYIQEFFQKEVRFVPGFVSAKFHTNAERSVLINYATWQSLEQFHFFVQQIARASELSKKIQAYSSKADVVYELPFSTFTL